MSKEYEAIVVRNEDEERVSLIVRIHIENECGTFSYDPDSIKSITLREPA